MAISIRVAGVAIAISALQACTKPSPEAAAQPIYASRASEPDDFQRVVLAEIKYKAAKYDGQRIEFEGVFDPPPAGTTLSPPDECTPELHVLSAPTFPNLDTPDAPECFRLEPGRIADLSSISPKQQTRVRVRGTFHAVADDAGMLDDDPANVLRTSLSVDAFDSMDDRSDYGPATVLTLQTAPISSTFARVATTGEWFSYFEGWNLTDPTARDHGVHGETPTICLKWSPSVKSQHGPRLAHARVRGRLFVTPPGDCDHTILVDSFDVLPFERRDGG